MAAEISQNLVPSLLPVLSAADAVMWAVTGRGNYVGDLARPETLCLGVVRSDLPHGRIRSIDPSAALQLPGVHCVLSAAQLEAVPRIPIRVGPTERLQTRLQPVLATDRVRYVGEPIAVVVADSDAVAEDAAGLVYVDIDPYPPADLHDRGSPLWDEHPDNLLIDLEDSFGDVAAAFAGAATLAELELSTGRRTGAPIEPRGLIAEWDRGVLHIWGVTKFVDFTRRTLAGFFGIDPGSVICHRVDVGGMFGVRGELYPEDFLVPWAARITGRPVRWIEQRRAHFLATNHAGAQHHRVRIGLDRDGKLLGLDVDVTLDAGAYPRPIGSRIAHIVVESLPGPYRWQACRIRCRGIATTRTPIGTVRGPAAFETTFVRERALDVAARRGGFDPLQVRRHSLVRHTPHSLDFQDPQHRLVYDSGDFPALLDGLVKRCGYEDLRTVRDRRRRAGELVGLGWGCFVVHSALGGVEQVALDLGADGEFVVRTSASEVGQGLDAMARNVVVSVLGVEPDLVTVWSGDSEALEGGNGTFSSRSTVFVGSAALDAATRLGESARTRASELLGCDPARIVITPFGPQSAEGSLTWKEIAPLSEIGEFRMERPTFGFGAHLGLVSVDRETGEVAVERIVTAYDCGRALDPSSVEDQIRGAAVMGLGGAVLEWLAFDPDGNPLSATFVDYLLPRAADVPPIEVAVYELEPAPGNPLGVKGAGEAGVIGAGAAIANAVADALGERGERITTLPIRPQTVLSALTKRTYQ